MVGGLLISSTFGIELMMYIPFGFLGRLFVISDRWNFWQPFQLHVAEAEVGLFADVEMGREGDEGGKGFERGAGDDNAAFGGVHRVAAALALTFAVDSVAVAVLLDAAKEASVLMEFTAACLVEGLIPDQLAV